MKEESITDANNITADTFSHVSNVYRENENKIFTSEKIDKSDELVDAVKNLTINNAKYYESNTVTVSDTQGDLACNPETINHTSNINFEQKLLSYQTTPVLSPPKNLSIDQGIATIILTPQTLLTPETKKIVADVVLGGAWIHRTQRQVISMGV